MLVEHAGQSSVQLLRKMLPNIQNPKLYTSMLRASLDNMTPYEMAQTRQGRPQKGNIISKQKKPSSTIVPTVPLPAGKLPPCQPAPRTHSAYVSQICSLAFHSSLPVLTQLGLAGYLRHAGCEDYCRRM